MTDSVNPGAARSRGVKYGVSRQAGGAFAIEGLDVYNTDRQPHKPSLVIGYATPPDHAFASAVARLCAALS